MRVARTPHALYDTADYSFEPPHPHPPHTVLEAFVVRVQEEVLEAIGDIVVRQELQIVLIKLEFQRVLVMDLERESQYSGLDSWLIRHINAITNANHYRQHEAELRGRRTVKSSEMKDVMGEKSGILQKDGQQRWPPSNCQLGPTSL